MHIIYYIHGLNKKGKLWSSHWSLKIQHLILIQIFKSRNKTYCPFMKKSSFCKPAANNTGVSFIKLNNLGIKLIQ